MISFLLSLAMATTVYVPMGSQLETTVAHHFVNKTFHSEKKDMIAVTWIDCKDREPRECALERGYWVLDIYEYDDGDSKQVNLFLLNGKAEIVAEAIINKRYKIEKIPQVTKIKTTVIQKGTIAPKKTKIEKPPLLVRKEGEITEQDISQAVIRLMGRIGK
tara:strand:- start:1994 stop:2476 length:483 start_codon:yes stop_codon:yes gene_type:complete